MHGLIAVTILDNQADKLSIIGLSHTCVRFDFFFGSAGVRNNDRNIILETTFDSVFTPIVSMMKFRSIKHTIVEKIKPHISFVTPNVKTFGKSSGKRRLTRSRNPPNEIKSQIVVVLRFRLPFA